MMMQMHVISAIRWWMDGWSKDLNVQTPEKELTPIINNDLVHKWLPGVASREKVLQRQRLPNRRSLCSLDHHPKIWWSCVSLVGPHYNAKREGLLASAVLRSMDLDIQGALFYCSSRFSVTTWKIMSCSQPGLGDIYPCDIYPWRHIPIMGDIYPSWVNVSWVRWDIYP